MVHIDENQDGEVAGQAPSVPSDPTLAALGQLKKRMTAHVQKTQLVNQKLAYRVICLEQQLQELTAQTTEEQEAVDEVRGGH